MFVSERFLRALRACVLRLLDGVLDGLPFEFQLAVLNMCELSVAELERTHVRGVLAAGEQMG